VALALLITSPVVAEPAIRRLVELHRRCDELITVVDHPANARAGPGSLRRERRADRRADRHRSGDPPHRRGIARAALELAQRIRALARAALTAGQFYCGVQQHIARFADRDGRSASACSTRSVIALLTEHQAAPAIVTALAPAATGSMPALGCYTEWQVGSYVFMDRQYAECEHSRHGGARSSTRCFVEATVVGANHRGMATIDAGFKALATDGGPPVILSGARSRRRLPGPARRRWPDDRPR